MSTAFRDLHEKPKYYCPYCDEYFYEEELDLNFTCPNCGSDTEEE